MAKLIDITGQTFGRLKVLRKAPQASMWECMCSCGNIKLTTGTNLRRGTTTSCGCVFKEKLAERNRRELTEEPWLADMKYYVRRNGYRKNRSKKLALGSNQFAKKEGSTQPWEHPSLEWHLTLDEYKTLVTSDCFYCGAPPSQKPKGVLVEHLKRNGIDRKDNETGYVWDNCVPCCASCNREKRAQSVEEFISNTKRRYLHLLSKGLITK